MHVRHREAAARVIVGWLLSLYKTSHMMAKFKKLKRNIEVIKARLARRFFGRAGAASSMIPAASVGMRCCVQLCKASHANGSRPWSTCSWCRIVSVLECCTTQRAGVAEEAQPRPRWRIIAPKLRWARWEAEAAGRRRSRQLTSEQCMQTSLRKHSLSRDARIITLKLQWARWEARHKRRIASDVKHRGAALASEPVDSVVKDCDFEEVEESVKTAVCKRCGLMLSTKHIYHRKLNLTLQFRFAMLALRRNELRHAGNKMRLLVHRMPRAHRQHLDARTDTLLLSPAYCVCSLSAKCAALLLLLHCKMRSRAGTLASE